MKKVLILGANGYIGRSLYPYLVSEKYNVAGLDNFSKDKRMEEAKATSLIPTEKWENIFDIDICDYKSLHKIVNDFRPDAIVHLAEQPSAPYSMMDREKAIDTQRNNILGTLNLLWVIREVDPNIHLVKLGTMGVYGTHNTDIPESNEPYAYDPASFYHNSKAADSINIRKACIWWGLNATDLHQGVVYGHIDSAPFHYDSVFGTVINRFLVQALYGSSLTVYGAGGQTRGFININDTVRCIRLAIDNPSKGYRVFNQITETFNINTLAKEVSKLTGAEITHIDNPRVEDEDHEYHVKHDGLINLGLKPRYLKDEIGDLWDKLQKYKKNIDETVIMPGVLWRE